MRFYRVRAMAARRTRATVAEAAVASTTQGTPLAALLATSAVQSPGNTLAAGVTLVCTMVVLSRHTWYVRSLGRCSARAVSPH